MRVDRGGGGLDGAGGVRGQVLGHGRLEGCLRVPVHGRGDLQRPGQHGLLPVGLDQLPPHVLAEHRHVVVGAGLGRRRQAQRFALLGGGRGGGDHAEVGHRGQHAVAALACPVRVDPRVAGRRGRQELRQRRALSGVELGRRHAEVGQGSGLDAPGVLAEVDLVEVALEDLVLAHLPFERDRDHGLADLAGEGAFRGEVGVLDVLLGQRRPPLGDPARAHVGDHGAQQRHRVDPGVLVEPGVLRGDHRVARRRGRPRPGRRSGGPPGT